MKKLFVFSLAVCSLFAFASCKSSKSEYKKLYDTAQERETAEGQGQASEPIEIAPVTSSTTPKADATYRSEKVVLATGAAGSLKAFSVVCGSFSSKTNADALRQKLVGEGYNALVVQNPTTGMYRVVCASYDDKQQAADARESFKANHPGDADFQKAWLLYNK